MDIPEKHCLEVALSGYVIVNKEITPKPNILYSVLRSSVKCEESLISRNENSITSLVSVLRCLLHHFSKLLSGKSPMSYNFPNFLFQGIWHLILLPASSWELFFLVSWCCHWVVFCCVAPSFTHALHIDIQYSTLGPFSFNAARNHGYKIWTKSYLPTADIANWFGKFSVILRAILEFSKMLQASTKWLEFAHEKTRFPPALFSMSIVEELICSHDFKFQKSWSSFISLQHLTQCLENMIWLR